MPVIGPVDFPSVRSRLFVDRQHVRRSVMIALHDDQIVEDDGRTRGGEAVLERPVFRGERTVPDQLAIERRAHLPCCPLQQRHSEPRFELLDGIGGC